MDISPPITRNIVAYRGLYYSKTFVVLQDDLETPFNLEDCEISGSFSPEYGSPRYDYLEVDALDDAAGIIIVRIREGVSLKWEPNLYHYNIFLTKTSYTSSSSSSSSEEEKVLIFKGLLEIKGTTPQ